MKHIRVTTVLWTIVLALVLAAGGSIAADVPRMSVDELNSRLGEPGLAVIDTRSAGDWGSSSEQVKGAVRRNPSAVAAWAEEYERGQTIVAYCA